MLFLYFYAHCLSHLHFWKASLKSICLFIQKESYILLEQDMSGFWPSEQGPSGFPLLNMQTWPYYLVLSTMPHGCPCPPFVPKSHNSVLQTSISQCGRRCWWPLAWVGRGLGTPVALNVHFPTQPAVPLFCVPLLLLPFLCYLMHPSPSHSGILWIKPPFCFSLVIWDFIHLKTTSSVLSSFQNLLESQTQGFFNLFCPCMFIFSYSLFCPFNGFMEEYINWCG